MNDVEKCAQAVYFVQLARQRGRQIKAETVHVHLKHPIPQAVHDELEHPRMPHV